MKRILCLWLPDWSTQRVRKERALAARALPEEAPIALYRRDPRRGEVIAACNAAARELGVRTAMPLAEAKTLLRSKHSAALVTPYNAQADEAALAALANACERYSPCVGLGAAWPRPFIGTDQAAAFDSLLLDVTSIGALFGGEAQLAAAIYRDFAAQGYVLRIAISANIATAWGLAHFAGQPTIIVKEGWSELLPLPPAALRLPAWSLEILKELGLETIEQLAALPLDALATRFGVEFVRQLQRAQGQSDEPLVPLKAAPQFQEQWPLEYPTTDREVLALILEQLAQRLSTNLRRRDLGALQLACRLDIAESPPRLLQINLYRPSADARHFIELLRLQGEVLRLRGAIGRVGLSVLTTARLEHRQGLLFAGVQEREDDELAALINRLSSRLGREQVLRPKSTRDVLPERAYDLQPLAGNSHAAQPAALAKKATKRKSQTPAEPTASTAIIPPYAHTRPLSLLPQPIPLVAVSIAPDGPPLSFTYQGQVERIQRHWGPERIETAWWHGPSVRRDYYRVEVAAGRRFWLFRELRTGRWFLHGHFD